MKSIFRTWNRRHQLRTYPEHIRQILNNEELTHRILKAKRIICNDNSAIYKHLPRVSEFFATQDQTEASRFKVIQLCGSLALCGHAPHYVAIHQAVSHLGVPVREVEVEDNSERRIYGRLDRMWYVLTDRKGVEEEGFEMGVTVQTLANQLEAKGNEVMFLLQKGPKRLLGVTAYIYEPREDIVAAAEELHKMGITIEIAGSTPLEKESGAFVIPDNLNVTLSEFVPIIRAAKELR